MQAGLNAALQALDSAAAPVRFYVRDDDAGWDDARLFALLECAELAGVPIDLAVIPQACSDALAHALCARIDAAPLPIGVHQHGFAHINHEAVGRKCEFGQTRGIEAQRRDLCRGQARLRAQFGARLDRLFTPPWNRCSALTPALLAHLGYGALSRDHSAPPQDALPEWPVHVDWCREWRKAVLAGEHGADRIGQALARAIAGGDAVGVMLHHAQMTCAELVSLQALFKPLTQHPHAHWIPMRELSDVAGADAVCDWTGGYVRRLP